jgi:hypothetical protein
MDNKGVDMSRTRFFGVCVVGVLVLFALTASVAAAEEKTKMLPESGVSFTSKGKEGALNQVGSIFNVKCKKGKGSGTITSANLGAYKADFEECKDSLGGTCTGAGEASGIILNEGEYHFWLAKESLGGVNTLVGALAFLPKEAHFTCVDAGINNLVLVKGCVAALATPLNTLASITTDVYAESSTGVQLITKVLPANSTTETECVLLSEKNAEGFKQSSLNTTVENEGFKSGTTAITVLLMNPEAKE